MTGVRGSGASRCGDYGARASAGLLALCALGAAGCGLFDGSSSDGSSGASPETVEAGPEGDAFLTLSKCDPDITIPTDRSGDACESASTCAQGLVCGAAGLCEPSRASVMGAGCVVGDECADGLACIGSLCAPAGSGAAGASCVDDRDCASRLRCSGPVGAATCQAEGTSDFDEPCSTDTDCDQGLVCKQCWCQTTPWTAPSNFASGSGGTCPADVTGPVRAYFEVPGAAQAAEGDFFRLPFPNDARRQNGRLDLQGFPTPGTFPLGVDPVALYVSAIQANDTAWGTYETVTFRFSGDVAVAQADLAWVDVTAGAPEYGSSAGLLFRYSATSSAYVCAHSLAVRRPQGAPLLPNHTYAVWVRKGNPALAAVQRAEDFDAVMGAPAPADPRLAAVYASFAPLRAYLGDKGIDPASVLVASVITVGDTMSTMRALAAAVASTPAPTAHAWVKCGGGAVSPCPQAEGSRACGPGDPNYDEYDALVSLPIFQRGTAPYSSTGGDIDPTQTTRQDVCMAITVPRSPMPASGWPLVVFAHGTGGSYRDHVTSDVAGVLATGAVPCAVLGIDQVEHGPRRGASTTDPDELFYNFLNPAAARGNPLQGAADQLSLARFGATLRVTAAESGGAAFQIDPDAIVFFGHSQGSTEGSLMLPFGDAYKGALLSGNGAGLIDALLSKKSPIDLSMYVPTLLQDPDVATLGDFHPVLSLLQEWIDPADPLNFASAVAQAPLPDHSPKHAFQTYGIGDTYAPPVTLATYALAGGLTEVAADTSVHVPDRIGALVPVAPPLAGNVSRDAGAITLGVREYAPPAGSDGHFVVFDNAAANADMVTFLGMAAAGQVPRIGPPH